MPNLINLSQLRQDQLTNAINTPINTATGTLFALITGTQIQTGIFDSRYVKNTGNEPISGIKAFVNRPTFAGTGLLASGEPLSLSQTGRLYPSGNPSGFTPVSVTGSTPILNATFSGIGGAQVILSGNSTILISGGAGTSVGGGAGVSLLVATGSINSGGFTGNILLSGAGDVTIVTGNQVQGVIIISGNTGGYANFLTLGTVGGVRTIQTTGTFPSGIVSGSVIISGVGDVTVTTGAAGQIVISGTPSAAGAGGVTSLAATGTTNTGFFTGDAMLSGAGNIVVSTGTPINKLIVISGNTGAYAGFLTLGNVGGVRTLQTTGAYPSGFTSGNVIISGIGNVSVTTGVNGNIVISGDTGAYANFGGGGGTTGQAILFDSGIQQSITIQSFQFPITFNSPPYVITQVKYLGNTGAGVPTVGVSGVTRSGFSGVYNIPFNTTGYTLSIYAASGAFAPVFTAPATTSRGISFFTPYVLTGLSVQEAFIPVQMTITGFSLGATTSGSGPAHLSSGASGSIIFSQLTGEFYQRGTGNNTSVISPFSFNSGVLYSEQGGLNVIATGKNRVGISIFSGLSGIENMTLGLYGFI